MKKRNLVNKIAKVLKINAKVIVPEANLILDLGADFLDMKEIVMTVEEISGKDNIETYASIETVGDIFQLCGV